MEFWLDLLFGNPVGLASMLVILGTIGLCTFFAIYFLVKINKEPVPPQHSHKS